MTIQELREKRAKAWNTARDFLDSKRQADGTLTKEDSKTVTNAPGTKTTPPADPTATDEYKNAFWNIIRNKGDQLAVRNDLHVGTDTEGGYLVPDEFDCKLILPEAVKTLSMKKA